MNCFSSKIYFLVILLLLSMGLSSCMLGPDFHSPKSPPIKSYTGKPLLSKTVALYSADNSGQAQYFALGQDLPAEWWQLFHSESLNQLIATGIRNSPNLAAAQAALRSAKEALAAQIGNSLYPALSAQMTANRQGFSDAAFGLNNNSTIFNLFNPSFNIAYTLDAFGGLRRGIESQRAQLDYQNYLTEGTYLTLTSNIATTAITIASLKAQIQATQQLIQAQEEILQIVRKQYGLGGVSGADVLTQETQVAQSRAKLPPLEQLLAQNLHVLSVLIGQFPSESQIPPLDLAALNLPTRLPISLPSSLVRQRPDIQAAEALLHSASAQIGVAAANLYPQITLNGSYGWQSNFASELFSPHSSVWNYGAQITQPLFNGGALMAKKRQAIANYEQAEAQYRQTVLQAFQNVADSLRAIENDARTFRAQKQAEISAQATLLLTQKQFQLGGVSYLSLLNAERQYQQTKIGRIQAQASRYTDTIALFQALGGGWWNRGVNEKMKAKSQYKGA